MEVVQIRRSDISFQVRTENNVDIIDISGQLDAFTTSDARDEFNKLTDARRYKLVLNLREVNYVNSTAIGVIVALAQYVRKRKGDVKIFGMKADVRRIFDIVGTSRILEIFETEQEALNSFS